VGYAIAEALYALSFAITEAFRVFFFLLLLKLRDLKALVTEADSI
jgi:hypothetical protein